jgi:hypothetical protein
MASNSPAVPFLCFPRISSVSLLTSRTIMVSTSLQSVHTLLPCRKNKTDIGVGRVD